MQIVLPLIVLLHAFPSPVSYICSGRLLASPVSHFIVEHCYFPSTAHILDRHPILSYPIPSSLTILILSLCFNK